MQKKLLQRRISYDKMIAMGKKAYAEDYVTVDSKDDHGRDSFTAVYKGDYFEIDLDEQGIILFRRRCMIVFCIIVLLHVSAGFLQNQGMYQYYIALPYVLAFFPMIYAAAGIFRLPKTKRKYRRDEIGLSLDRLKVASIILLIFLGIGVLGDLSFLLLSSRGETQSMEWVFLAFEVPAVGAAYTLNRLQRKIRVEESSKER
jgi:hypothetical protein